MAGYFLMLDAIEIIGASDLDLVTQDLQSCLRGQNIDEALKLAEKRHNMIVALFDDLENKNQEMSEIMGKSMQDLSFERSLLQTQSSVEKTVFVARRTAVSAYMKRH
jgi:hypothetical protein